MSSQNKESDSRDGHDSKSENAQGKSPKSMTDWQDIISQRIEEAVKQGAFENLQGEGKPLNLKKNAFTPDGNELAFDLLKNNDLAPAWILERKEIQAAIAKLRTQIQQDIAYYRAEKAHPDVAQSHVDDMKIEDIMPQIRIEKWRTAIATINKKIDTLNLTQPIAHLEIIKLRLSEELSVGNKN